MKKIVIFIIALLLQTQLVFAATQSAQKLEGILNNLKTMSANFKQLVRDGKGRLIQRSNGKMAMSRPGKFRWETKYPMQQLIIADGKKVWVYDKDLEQVTVKSLKKDIGGTPGLFLSGYNRHLNRDYQISYRNNHYILKPKSKDASYRSLELWFRQQQLLRMHVLDKLEQASDLTFTHIKVNKRLAANLFRFKVPPGVDVVQ